jgi:hypothetical protein
MILELLTIDNIILGHRRLSIIDLSKNGNQPMFMEVDITRLSSLLDWIPAISKGKGLEKTIRYWKTKKRN